MAFVGSSSVPAGHSNGSPLAKYTEQVCSTVTVAVAGPAVYDTPVVLLNDAVALFVQDLASIALAITLYVLTDPACSTR